MVAVELQARDVKKADDAGDLVAAAASTLVFHNVTVGSKRTSLRLEQTVWDALAEICRREDLTLSTLCGRINDRRHESTLTAALRVFVLSYFKVAATEEGHASAGHGTLGDGFAKHPGTGRTQQRPR